MDHNAVIELDTDLPEAMTVLASLPHPVLVVAVDGRVRFANTAAEAFFGHSGLVLRQRTLQRMIGAESPLMDLMARVRDRDAPMADRAMRIEGPELDPRVVDASATPMIGDAESIVLLLREVALADRVGQSESRRLALRPVTGMAALLAHEIKNPLSGIRGAAQLLGAQVTGEQTDLTDLIRDEVDRITELVDRMDVFRDQIDGQSGPINIHEVLAHVRRLAKAGFGAGVEFEERYDPSLPPVLGGRSQLIQAFLNLVKNACEAAGKGGRVVLSTAYRHDLGVVRPQGMSSAHLPLEVRIEDNGPGIPDEMMSSLFEPFVTSRAGGTGLGLAIVAKVVADHGGVIECRSKPGQTVFITRWPMAREDVSVPGGAQ